MLRVINQALRIMKWKELGMEFGKCSMCGKILFIKLRNDDITGIRCVRCRASVTSMAIASALKEPAAEWENKKIYELSSRGPFFRFLQKRAPHLSRAGFKETEIILVKSPTRWDYNRRVVAARK